MDVGQPEVPPLEFECQLFVVDAEAMQDSRLQVMDVHSVLDGVVAELGHRSVSVLDRVGYNGASDFPTLVDASLRRGKPDVLVVAGSGEDTGRIARAAWSSSSIWSRAYTSSSRRRSPG